jgi:hypothetical protein
MFEFLIIAWVAWQFTNLLVQDGIHAVKGTTPPRHSERMERLRRGETLPSRYGLGGYLRDLWDDALRADVERRRRKRATEAGGQQVPNPNGPAAPSTGGRREDPPPPVAVPAPDGGPASAATRDVVHDDCTYCLGCERCRPPAHGWTCQGCGENSGPVFPSRDAAQAAFANHRCRSREQKPPPTGGQARVDTPDEVDDGPDDTNELVAGTQPLVRGLSRQTLREQDRCIAVTAGPGSAYCGAPVWRDDGAPPGNQLCRGHSPENSREPAPPTAGEGTSPVLGADDPQSDSGDGGNRPAARVIPFPNMPAPAGEPTQGDNMPTDTTNPSGIAEVTGLRSAVEYAKGVAAAHASHGGAEGFVSSLGNFEVGPATIAKVMEAREASNNAAAKWAAAAAAVEEDNERVREAYAASGGEAGNKQFVTNE